MNSAAAASRWTDAAMQKRWRSAMPPSGDSALSGSSPSRLSGRFLAFLLITMDQQRRGRFRSTEGQAAG